MYNQTYFKKVTSVQVGSKAASISGGIYRKVSGDGHASSVYAGGEALGTKVSSTSHNAWFASGHVQYGGTRIMGNEKETMQNLNERLASYITQVHDLEKANAELEGQIWDWHSKNKGNAERDDQRYFQTIEELRKQILDATIENASIFLQIDNVKLMTDDFKTKYWSFRLETRESKIFSTIYSNSPSTKTGAGGSTDGTIGATYLRNNDLWNTLCMEKESGRVRRKDTGLRTSEILYGPMKRGLNLGEETFIGI
ncbi:unnamed protein product [Ranitomeya imitator]|uniref:IF rod domain-containing protein n=1 Tax=Ranitomeya imitator TaxID=111125 RepID=A0ABN9LTU9_9NEOB|nr:unnamed protein product [Ranitomeya imitator]